MDTKFDIRVQVFLGESWKPIYFRVKRSKVGAVTVMGLWTLSNAAFFLFSVALSAVGAAELSLSLAIS